MNWDKIRAPWHTKSTRIGAEKMPMIEKQTARKLKTKINFKKILKNKKKAKIL